MTTYLVSYDLVGKSENDYPQLLDALRKDGAVRILWSQWLVRSSGNGAGVRDRYRTHLDANDRIFVTAVNDWAYYNIQNLDAAKKLLP